MVLDVLRPYMLGSNSIHRDFKAPGILLEEKREHVGDWQALPMQIGCVACSAVTA